MKLYELYCITNKVNGKRYIGQTCQGYRCRYRQHLICGELLLSKRPLYTAIHKYGKENFEVKRLLINIPEDKIDFYEILWIQKLNTLHRYGHGYNLTYGGQGIHGYKYTKTQRDIISRASCRMWQNLKSNPQKLQERNSKISAKLKGHITSQETKLKMRKASIGKRLGVQNGFYGKTHTQQVKDLISLQLSIPIVGIELKTGKRYEFPNILQAGKFVLDQGLTKNKYANSRICACCKHRAVTAYGFKWLYKDKCNDYSDRK